MTDALRIEGYALGYRTRAGEVPALTGIDLSIAAGETLGLVGASGSGKSSLAWAILRMLPANAREGCGTITLGGADLRTMSARDLAHLRGKRIGMVFQDPSTSLNPTLRLGAQVMEVLVRHRGLTRAAAQAEARDWLARTGLADPDAIMRRYPHQVSGGEKQRVVIATAFACRPELIILDEPTTALDVITGRLMLDLFASLRAEMPVACLYISHDLGLVGHIADRVAVLAQGRIVEQGPTREVLLAPRATQTRKLLDAIPDPTHRHAPPPPPKPAGLLAVNHVSVTYGRPGRLGRLLGAAPAVIAAHDVQLSLEQGEILGIVGESGSGKSTLARALTGISRFDGEVVFDGRTRRGDDRMPQAWHRDVQIVFQNPDASLNPRHRIATILSRPLRLHGGLSSEGISDGVARLLTEVGLPAAYATRHPHELSGGEKQRVAIARAFAANPKLVICDEITAALDVIVQAEIVRLLLALQARHGTACLFITHDLNLVRHIAHRIAVMRRGELVDLFEAEDFAATSRHPYTKALLEAVASLARPESPA
jgi:peptide/nickel transport system ATP-binding protein